VPRSLHPTPQVTVVGLRSLVPSFASTKALITPYAVPRRRYSSD